MTAAITALRNRVRWTWRRARYVAQTEGLGTLGRRTAAMAGLAGRDDVPEQLLVRPMPTPIDPSMAARWPASVLILGPGPDRSPPTQRLQQRARQLAGLRVPVTALEPGQDWRSASQLASLVIIHPTSWSDALAEVVAEARRLGQQVIADLDGTEAVPGGPDALLLPDEESAAVLRSRLGEGPPVVYVLPAHAPAEAMADVMADLGGGA